MTGSIAGIDSENTRDVCLDDLLSACRSSQSAEGSPSLALRRDRLDRLRLLVNRSADDLVEAVQADYVDRSATQSIVLDVLALNMQIRHTRRHLASWMRPQRRWVGLPFAIVGGKAWIEWQPLGVVGIISPWNFPVALTVGPLAQALAAGNRVLCKVSEATPATSEVLKAAVADLFDPTEVSIVTGGPDVSARFSALPFDHILFTGSTATGRQVLRAAADHLTPVTLELGGKCPVVIAPDSDIRRAAACLMFGKTMNAGQYCVAPDYAFVPRPLMSRFVDECRSSIADMYPTMDVPDYTAIVNATHYRRIQGLLADACDRGATATELAAQPPGVSRRIVPTLISGVDDSMAMSREEIFGPLLPLFPYDDIDEAISYINARPKPLAAYYFGANGPDLRRFIDRTESGGVTINDIMLHVGLEDLPFGGVGDSGMGQYHGRAGFETFSHGKPVVRPPRTVTPMLAPPYSPTVGRVLRGVARLEAKSAQRAISNHRNG
jgi:coniferyl-aldehyde dehydrogenase